MNARDGHMPAFMCYAADWLSSGTVCAMSFEQQGVYMRLLCHQWVDGSIPADQRALARLLRASEEDVAGWWVSLGASFPPHPTLPGRLANQRLERERVIQAAFRQAKSESGKKGNEARWGSHSDRTAIARGAIGSRVAKHRSSPSPSPSTEESTLAGALSRARATKEAWPTVSPEGRALVSHFQVEFQRTRMGQVYLVTDKDCDALRSLLAAEGVTLQEAKLRATRLLESPEPFHARVASLALLASQWNQFAVDVRVTPPTAGETAVQTIDRMLARNGHQPRKALSE
jgi:uncharacterized protein YdaU (DUF1376 family)